MDEKRKKGWRGGESLVEYEFFEVRIGDPDTQGRLEGVRMGNKVS